MSPILVAVCLAAQHGAAAENRIDFEKQIPPWSSSPDAPIASYLQDRRKRLRWLALSFGVVKIAVNQRAKVRVVKAGHSRWTRTFFTPFRAPSTTSVSTVLRIEQRAPESPRAIAGWFFDSVVQSGLERRAHARDSHRPNPQPDAALPHPPRNEKTPEC